MRCTQCEITLESTQTATLMVTNPDAFLGEAQLESQTVWALANVGAGRVVFSGDSDIIFGELTDCPLWAWLGSTPDEHPRLLTFGSPLGQGIGDPLESYPGQWQYAGENLPPEYLLDPEALRADWDVVAYCAEGITFLSEEATTLVEYVNAEGGGLYLSAEYWPLAQTDDFEAINEIAIPLGAEFLPTNLEWGRAQGAIMFDCFPPPG